MTVSRGFFTVVYHRLRRRALQASVALIYLATMLGLLASAATDRIGRPLNDEAHRYPRRAAAPAPQAPLPVLFSVAPPALAQVEPSPSPSPTPLLLAQAPRPLRSRPPARPPVPAPQPPVDLAEVPLVAGAPNQAQAAEASAAAAAAATAPQDPDRLLNLDFRNTDIKSVIKFLSEQTGTNYLYDESIAGKITLIGPKRVTLREAVWLLESLLEFKGFTVVRVGDFKKVIPIMKAQGDIIETRLDYRQRTGPAATDDKTVTQLLRLKYTGVDDIKTAVSSLLARPNAIITYPATNTLILTENALNIERLVRIIKELDTPVQGKQIHVVPLRNTLAKALGVQLDALLKQKASEKLEPETRQVTVGHPAVIADERTNSIVVVCLAGDFPALRRLIEDFDKDVRFTPRMKMVRLLHADAEGVATALDKIMKVAGDAATQAFAVTSDKRTNTILLSSISDELLERAMAIIESLDGEIEVTQNIIVKVHHLEFAEAEKVAELLKGFDFVPVEEKRAQAQPKQGEGAAAQAAPAEAKTSIVPDKATNSLIVTCPRWRWVHILDVIKRIDVVRPQVMVEALIVEIDVTRAKELGLDFNLLNATSSSGGSRPFMIGSTGNLGKFLSGSGIANGLSVGVLTGTSFDLAAAGRGDLNQLSKIGLLIRALKNDTRANILSAPQLTTSDNEVAKISVGEQIQLPTGFSTAANSGLNTITNYTTEDVGIVLEITPRITRNDHVILKVKQVIKSRTSETLYDVAIPVISKRDLETNITVKDDTTIVLGGLIAESSNAIETRIPVLGNLPVLGKFFRNKRHDSKKTNLLVFLTPHVMRDATDTEEVTDRARDQVRKMVATSDFTKSDLLHGLFPEGMEPSPAPSPTPVPTPRPAEGRSARIRKAFGGAAPGGGSS